MKIPARGSNDDDIFPAPELKKNFPIKNIKDGGYILDIGCSTGETTEYMNAKGYKVLGIDLDQCMIDNAKKKYGENSNLKFEVMDMTTIENVFGEELHGIVCIGNVLPHLKDKEIIKGFLRSCYNVLKDNSPLCIQIINFDKVKREIIKELPLIYCERVKFERFYNWDNSDNLVEFTGRITDKKENEVLENTVDLFMLTKDELVAILKEAGFKRVELYDDFKRSIYTGNSLALIVEAIK